MATLAPDRPMNIEGEHIVSFGGWLLALLGLIGGAIKWAVSSRDSRQRMVDESVARQYGALERRVEVSEKRADAAETRADVAVDRADELAKNVDRLTLAYRLVANALQQIDPSSTILIQAQALLSDGFPAATHVTDDMADRLNAIDGKDRR